MASSTTTLTIRAEKDWVARIKQLIKDQGRSLREVVTEQLDIWFAEQTGSTALIRQDEKEGKITRPKEPTPEIIEDLFRKLGQTNENGLPRTLTRVCKDPGMPSYTMLQSWTKENTPLARELAQRLQAAEREQAQIMADFLIETAAELRRGEVNHYAVNAIKGVIEYLNKGLDPQKWGAVETQNINMNSTVRQITYEVATVCPHCGKNTFLEEAAVEAEFLDLPDDDIEEREA